MTCAHSIGFGEFADEMNKKTEKMIGEILTTLEAAIPGDRQCTATKALVKQVVWKFNKEIKTSLEEKILNSGETIQ